MKKLLVIALLTLIPHQLLADSPAMPIPYVEPSEYGSFYFAMIPEKGTFENGAYKIETPAFGVMYQLLEDGNSAEIWRTEGWYAFRVYLSSNGEYLVRMGNWASGKEPSKEDLAVAFYHKGSLLRKYSTSDLIKRKRSVQRTVSHYFWQSNDQEYPRMEYQKKFLLKTIENRVYKFDTTTGEVVEQEKL